MPIVTSEIEQKQDRLLEIMAEYGRVAVALSADADCRASAPSALNLGVGWPGLD